MPGTAFGKWAVGFVISFFLFFALFSLIVASGQKGGDTFYENLYLAVPALLAAFSGILAVITGGISVFRDKERAASVYLATIIGFLVLIFCLGEILLPH